MAGLELDRHRLQRQPNHAGAAIVAGAVTGAAAGAAISLHSFPFFFCRADGRTKYVKGYVIQILYV